MTWTYRCGRVLLEAHAADQSARRAAGEQNAACTFMLRFKTFIVQPRSLDTIRCYATARTVP